LKPVRLPGHESLLSIVGCLRRAFQQRLQAFI
jgi:hypothetical protein